VGTATEGVAEPRGGATSVLLFILRLIGTLLIPVVAFAVLYWAFNYLRDSDSSRLVIVGVAILVGVGGIFALYWGMNQLVNRLPASFREGVRPYVFVGPALVILAVFLVYPVINTIITAFKDARSQSFVGLDNFRFVFTDDSMLRSIRNTFAWILIVPLFGVTIGLIFATLADRLRHGEAFSKSMIFLPMAISFAGASITWRLIYSFRPAGFGTNIGLLNGILLVGAAALLLILAWLLVRDALEPATALPDGARVLLPDGASLDADGWFF